MIGSNRLFSGQMLRCQVESFELLVFLLPRISLFLNKLLQILTCLQILSAAVDMHKFIHGKITPTNPNHNVLPLNLHKHPSSVVPVDSLRFPLECHATPDRQRLFVDYVCQFLINNVFFYSFVIENFCFNLLLLDFFVQSLNLTITYFQVLQQLQAMLLCLLAFILNI